MSRFIGVLVVFLVSCAPVGAPNCVFAPPQVGEQVKPQPHTAKAYYDCGKVIACGVWCRVSDECREIENEMENIK